MDDASKKQDIRNALRARRDLFFQEQTQEELQGMAYELRDTFLKRLKVAPFLDAAQKGRPEQNYVAGYVPVKSEASPLALLESLRQRHGLNLALPEVFRDGSMVMRAWGGDDKELTYGLFQTLIPQNALEISVMRLVFVLVPLLGVMSSGERIGYGGGYYDRFIARMRCLSLRVCCVGVAYPFQVCDDLPTQAHDQRIDAILMPQDLVCCTNRGCDYFA